jgi:SAM-dependent methyltransferase
MRLRIELSRVLLRVGGFIQSLALPLMKPDDLVEFTRQYYARPRSIGYWGKKDLLESGLVPDELCLLEKIPFRSGRMLVLCLGGGRDALAFAKMGFEVTGVDYVPEMVERAKAGAAERGLRIEGLVQDMSRLDLPIGVYDAAWLSAMMYSSIPTRARRIKVLRSIASALKPGGYFACQFWYEPEMPRRPSAHLLRQAFACLTLGNVRYEPGDRLAANSEFYHVFSSSDEARPEFKEGGFEVLDIRANDDGRIAGAVLKKVAEKSVMRDT